MRVWVTKTVLGAAARKTEIVFRSSSVRALELSIGDGGGIGAAGRVSVLDAGDGGGDVDRQVRTVKIPKSVETMRRLERMMRPSIAPSVRIASSSHRRGSSPRRAAKEDHSRHPYSRA